MTNASAGTRTAANTTGILGVTLGSRPSPFRTSNQQSSRRRRADTGSANQPQAAERQAGEHDQGEGENRGTNDRVRGSRRAEHTARETDARRDDEAAQEPEHEVRREGTKAEIPAERQVGDGQNRQSDQNVRGHARRLKDSSPVVRLKAGTRYQRRPRTRSTRMSSSGVECGRSPPAAPARRQRSAPERPGQKVFGGVDYDRARARDRLPMSPWRSMCISRSTWVKLKIDGGTCVTTS